MNPNREEVLFELALEKPSDKRAAFLDTMCEGDAALRARIEALLAAHEQTEGVQAQTAAAARATLKVDMPEAPDEAVGQVIGRYKVLQKIGEGGCGAVYMAEQTEPVRRRVALKVIKLGMDTKAVIARFEAERQALALMDHPNIAKVLDAGSTESGRPYFVMELVRGIKFTEYCDQNHLDTRTRLELFIQICQAIQHAHQKGIIHRDIKPSNILVTLHDGIPVPKVIDFGIAKATTGQQLTDKTLFTAYEQFIGTPAYMSPEQAEMSGLDVDTRSDIYSLGVLLYELLTGRTPFDPKELMSQGLDAMRKTIREKDPVRPSTKLHTLQGEDLTTTAKSHGVDVPKLVSQLRGDLDWIVMKCLEKDRTRRYESANGLAMDLKRHLNNETVVARPPSKLYEFQKTFRRHKVGFAATAAIIVVLAAGVLVSTWQAVRATRAKAGESVQRQKAEANEKKAVAAQEQAQTQELIARQRAYASDMNVAMQAIHENNLGQALDLLNRQRPLPGQKDLRGWEWRYLWQQTRSDTLSTLSQIKGEVNSLAVSSDGNYLAVGAFHQGGLSVWDLRTRQVVAHLATNDLRVWSAFSPAEPLLAFTGITPSAARGLQFTVHLWNATTRQMVAEIPLDDICRGLAFSKDGKTLVTSLENLNGLGRHIILWRASDGTKLASYPAEQNAIETGTGFAATSDLSLAAYAYGSPNPQKVCVFDLRTGKELWTAVAAPHYVLALAFSPDGKILASSDGFDESDIYLWDVATGRKIGQLVGHKSWVGSLVFWPDGTKLASASADQTIRVWDVASRKCLDVMHGNREELWRLALLPDQKTLVSGAKDGTVCFWDTSVPHPRLANITWPVKTLAWTFTPDNRAVLTLDANGEAARWTGADFQEKEPLFEVGTDKVVSNPFSNRFSPDGRFLAIGSANGVSIWDVSRKVLWRQLTNGASGAAPLRFTADGNKLVTASWPPPSLNEWDLTTGRETQSWPGIVAGAYQGAGALSPDQQLCVVIDIEGDVVGRNLTSGNNVKLPLDALEASGAGFSPDGKFFAVASNLGFTRVWDTKTWKEVATLRGFRLAAHSVGFSPDGKRLATGGGASVEALKLWDTESWQNVINLQGSDSIFDEALFSPDGNSVGVLSFAGTLHVWRAPSWVEINAAEAKNPPASDSGATGRVENQ